MNKRYLLSVIAIISVFLGRHLLGEDFTLFLQWWLVVLILGLIFMPLTDLLFSSFEDRGYLFSKTIGIAVTGYIMWLFSSLRILKFNTTSCIIVAGLAVIINFVIFLLRYPSYHNKESVTSNGPRRPDLLTKKTIDRILTEELLFFCIFLLFLYVRGFKPEAYGTEKFMDYGFMATMDRTDYMPPQDFWYAGTSLNYYYVGQFIATFLSKLTFVGTENGYNLMLMMTGAFTFMLPFSIGYQLVLQYQKNRRIRRLLPTIGGLLAGAGVCIAGNMHYPIFKWLVPTFQKIFLKGQEVYSYWFPDATRFIGYNPETKDKTIHEFPAYSFVLGDLHAHVINILFVLTVLGILLAWLLGRSGRTFISGNEEEDRRLLIKEVFHPAIIMLGFFIGLFHMTNFWDYPIYYVVSGAIILFSNMIVYNFKGKAYLLTALQGIFILLLGELVCLPFTLNFNQISAQPLLTVARTPIYQLAILWGLPITTVIAFLIFTIIEFKTGRKRNKHYRRKKNQNKLKENPLLMYMKGLDSAELFILTIGLCAIGLILIPEIVYIKDIYSGDYKRANTMFKLTYQAFIIFGICFSFIFIRLLAYPRTKRQRMLAGIGLVLFTMTLCYSGYATKVWYGKVFDRKGYEGIDSTAFLKNLMPEDYEATIWLKDNIKGTPVVLEANGDSYSDYQRISVITGLPTVLGWYTHERLWKSEPGVTDTMVTDMLNKRAEDIKTIYTSTDKELVRQLLAKYKVEYLYVGGLEAKKYKRLNHNLIKQLGSIEYEAPNLDDRYETYIVRID